VRAYFTGWYTEIVADLPLLTNGRVAPLDGPGLGITVRDELFTRPDATVRRTGA
jgi:L-alanine-DL-glutamate epimerase-like enolase superfamily enzyme